jgi:hypothetical protein
MIPRTIQYAILCTTILQIKYVSLKEENMNRLVELIYWIKIFLSPFLILVAMGWVVYVYDQHFLWISLLLGITGTILGVFWAERVRRRTGTAQYMAKIYHTDDIASYDESMRQENQEATKE